MRTAILRCMGLAIAALAYLPGCQTPSSPVYVGAVVLTNGSEGPGVDNAGDQNADAKADAKVTPADAASIGDVLRGTSGSPTPAQTPTPARE